MGRGHSSARRALGSLALASLGVLLWALSAASEAAAYTYVLRPNVTLQTGAWAVFPTGDLHTVLDDVVLAPTAPTTITDYIHENGNGPITAEIGHTTVALRTGETVVRTRSMGYLRTGDGRSLDTSLRTGATVLGSGTYPASTPAGWRSLDSFAALTQAEVDDLRTVGTIQGSGASTDVTIYAAYLELQTDLPPPAPTVTAGQPAFGQGTSPSWSFSATPAAGFECRLERPGVVVEDWTACTSAKSYDLTVGSQPDAQYTFSARAVDDLGVAGDVTTSTYTLDRSAPLAPLITVPPASPAPGATAEWSFTTEAGALTSCRLTRGATVISDWNLCSSPAAFGGLTDGTYTFEVHATDMAGNQGPDAVGTYTRDSVAPEQPVITAAPPATGNAAAVSWSFTAEAGADVTCRLERGGTAVTGLDWAPCSGTRAYDLTSHGDGAYTFRVRATDASGNTSVEGTGSYVYDTVKPAPPAITVAPSSPSNTLSPSYTFTTDAGTTTRCRIENNGSIISNWSNCVSPRSYALGVQTDGVITFRVRATDTAGNVSDESTHAYTLDQTAPVAPTITGGPPSSSSDPSAAFQFTVESGTTPACQMEREGVVLTAWEPCSSPKGYDLASQADGMFTFRVRSTDAAGNTSATASRTFELDRVAPNQPSIVTRPGTATNNPNPSWSWTVVSGLTYRCRLDDGDGGSLVVSDWAVCTSPRSYDLSGRPDGLYTFRLRASDTAGNASTIATDTFSLDRSAPLAPTISSGPTGSLRVDQPSYAFTGEGGAALTCRMERPGTVVSDWSPCVSPRDYDLRLQPDAAYTFSVRATDAAGNPGAIATRAYTLDRTAPAPPGVTGPTGDSNDDTPVWSFTGEIGTTAECALDRGATTIRAFAPCSTPVGYNLTSDIDATYTVRVRITDAAGNTSTEGTRTYTLDRVKPPPPLLSSRPGTDTNAATLTWTYTTTNATGTTCRLERGATVVSDWTACTSPRSYASLPEGSYIFRVRASDAAGNVGDETADGTNVDRTAPAAPTITGGPTSASSDTGPAFTFTAETGAATSCRLEQGGNPVSDWSPCSSPRSYDISSQPDGGYTFRVRAVDAAGNTGPDANRGFTLDRVAPPAPTLTSRPSSSTNDSTPQWAFTATDATTFRCRLERGTTTISDWATCTSPYGYDLTSRPDGVYTFRVRASDIAANESTETADTFALDRAAPAAPTVTSGPTGDSQNASPSYAFTAEAGSTTECRLVRTGTATPVSDWSACTSPRAYSLSAQADGEYTFAVRARDAAGNTGAAGTRVYTLDRTAPAPPSIDTGPTSESADATPTYTWSGEAGATSECRVQRGTTDVRPWGSCTSPATFDLSSETDGPFSFGVRITDAAGNTSDPASRGYTLDRAAPDPPTISAGPAADSTDDTPSFSFSGEASAALECRIARGTTVIEDWASCTSPKAYTLTTEPDGTYTFAVRATDASGNVGGPATRSYTLDRVVPIPPTIDEAPGPQGNSRDPQWAFSTTESGRFFECRLMRGSATVFAWGPCSSPRSFSLLMQPDDTYTFAVRAFNAAGTRSDVATDTYRLDTAAPAPPGISGGPAPDSTDDRPEWSLTAEPSATLECRLDRGADVVSAWSPCSSPAGYDLTGEPDGTYTFQTRATDLAGNTSDGGSATYTLDRTVPAEPVFGTTPPAAGSATDPSWTFSTPEPGKTFECRVTRGTDVLRDWSACTSPLDLDLSAEPDGTYTVEIRTVNAAGTRSPITDGTYDLDRVRPDAPAITDAPPADSSDDTPTWSFAAEDGARFACQVERAGVVVRAWSTCTSPETQDLSGEPDGTYTFLVHATDAAGNVSVDTSRDFTLDRTVPGGPTFTARPTSPGADRTPEWSFSGDPDRTFECRLVRDGTDVRAWGPCTSPHTPDLGGDPDGTYTLHVRQVNRAQTRGPEATDDYVLDTTAPEAPAITGSPGPTGRLSAPRWTFTAEDGAAVECRLQLGGNDVRPWGACTSPRDYGLAGEPDGTYTFSVRATDAAGNTGPAATQVHILDRVAPEPPVVTGSPGPLGNGRAPGWGFTAEAGAVIECRFDRGATPLVGWAPCQSPRGFDLAGMPDGTYAFVLRAIDAAGNTSNETVSTYELDTTPGAVQILSGPGPLGRLRTPSWTFASEGATSFECRLSMREAAVADWQPCETPRGFDLAGQPDGVFRFAARATDAAGNLGPVADTDYELDTTPPAAPQIDRKPTSPSEDRSPTWRFSGETGAIFSCRVERTSSAAVRDWATCASPFTADLLNAGADDYRFLVRATDRAGNTGPAAPDNYELSKPAPEPPKSDPPASVDAPSTNGDGAGDATAVPPAPAPRRIRKKPRRAAVPAVPRAKRKPRRPAPERKAAAAPRRPRKAEPAPAPTARPEAREGNALTRGLRNVGAAVANAVIDHPDKSVFPASLIFLVIGFLIVQSRIDRSDPKLALAPVHADPDLEFLPPPAPAHS